MSDTIKLTQSRIALFQRCPEQYRRVEIEGDRIPPAWALVRGTGVHKAAEHNFRSKIETHVDLPRGELVDVAVTTVQEKVLNEGLFVPEGESKAKIVDEGVRQVVRLTELFADEVAPAYQPRAVEARIEADVAPGLVFSGALDVITEDNTIPDFKTKAKTGSQDEYDRSTQGTMYSLLHAHAYGVPPRAVVFEELVDSKIPKRVTFETTRVRDDFVALVNAAVVIERSIRSGVFPGAYGQYGAWWCSKESCGFWRTCPFVPKHKQ